MSDTKTDSIPTRKQVAEAKAATAEAPKRSLEGNYRVREGYMVAHGKHDENGQHAIAKGGEIIFLSHEEAASVIKGTMHQKNADGTSNGPAIETETSYNARIEAQRAHAEFLKSLEDMNGLPTG